MFKKYQSLENSYNDKFLRRFLETYPELQNETYIVTEKLDGANIQIYFEPGVPYRIGKRSDFLKEDETFFDIHSTVKKYQESLDKIQKHVEITKNKIRLYGEIYGSGIQKRVNYGDEKYIAFFDVEVNGELWAPRDFMHLAEGFDLPRVPVIQIKANITEVLSLSENFNTNINPVENNASEGLVIRPFGKNYYSHVGAIFILKKKSAKFSEKEGLEKPVKILDTPVLDANLKFKAYLNDNRVLSVFSKSGPMQEMSQMGEYIKLVLEDAKLDFLKENDISMFDKNQLKDVYNVGNLVVQLLKKHL